jgi:hypothetical protein
MPLRPFASLPPMSEESRCAVAAGGHGFSARSVYCHTPDNKIYRLSPDGKSVSVFATIPNHSQSDGALAFDRVGRFRLPAGGCDRPLGNPNPVGGSVYTIGARGNVRRVGDYPGPGGSDELAIAPGSFGAAAGWALVGPDPGAHGGAIVAVSPRGRTRTLARLPTGPNPIAVIAAGDNGAARAGLYVADTNTRNVYFARAAQLTPYRGAVIVGSELGAHFWILRPHGQVRSPRTHDRFAVRQVQPRSGRVHPLIGDSIRRRLVRHSPHRIQHLRKGAGRLGSTSTAQSSTLATH